MTRTLRALGLLLDYPSEELLAALPELGAEVEAEAGLGPVLQGELAALLAQMASTPLLELQAGYVNLFDRSPGLSLHLYEHVHGDARERGAALVRLGDVYARHGLHLHGGELPDYLPVVCEALSVMEPAAARTLLADAAVVLALLRERLRARDSLLSAVAGALLELSGAAPDGELVAELLDAQSAGVALAADLDQSWQESPVEFSVGAAHDSCGVGENLVQLRRGTGASHG